MEEKIRREAGGDSQVQHGAVHGIQRDELETGLDIDGIGGTAGRKGKITENNEGKTLTPFCGRQVTAQGPDLACLQCPLARNCPWGILLWKLIL